MEKKVKEGVKGKPVDITFVINGRDYEFRLVCPMCGETNFVFSPDYELGGCVNEKCDCICFVRLKDKVLSEGIGWVL